MRITITLTNELPPTSPTCLQFYNIIFRRCMHGGGHLKMWFLTGKLIYLPPGFYPFPSGADTMPIYDVILFELHPSCPFPRMDGWVGGWLLGQVATT